jgi:hypothetical protein
MLYTDYIIVKPNDLLSTLNKIKDQEKIELEFSFNFLRINRQRVKAVHGIIKPKLIFTISKEDCQKLVEFYKEHNGSGALIKPKENEIIFYGWDEKAGKDVKLSI